MCYESPRVVTIIKNSIKIFSSPAQATPCSCLAINRGSGLKEDCRFVEDVAQGPSNRKENKNRHKALEERKEAEMMMMEEKVQKGYKRNRLRKLMEESKEDGKHRKGV